MLNAVRPALVIVVALTLITGLAYPLAITGLAGLLFPHQAQGSLDREGWQADRLGVDRAGVHQ